VSGRHSRYLAQPTPSFWESLRYLCDARLAVSILLLAYVPLLGHEAAVGQTFHRGVFVQISGAYSVIAAGFSVLARLRRQQPHVQLLGQVLADIVMVGLITYAAGGARSGLGVLMILPTAGAAVLSTPLLSLFIAATASLVLLGESVGRRLIAAVDDQGGADGLFIAAVISATLFVTVFIVNRLARRLADQERLAVQRGSELRDQLALNELVIAELDQGVLVFNRDGGIDAMNPKARAILGLRPEASPASVAEPVLATLRALITHRERVAELEAGSGGYRRPKIRARLLVERVVLLEDLELLEDRAQQLKLAAMGRLSASIAHEIRNPLGAIRHAGNLLAERVPPGTLRRMTTIIEANSLRIDRIVEDVLSIARRSAAREPVNLAQFLETFLPEFIAQAAARPERIALQIHSTDRLLFDPHHLRQVLVNLLGNALRYAGDSPGAIVVSWQASDGYPASLRILDDGPGIDAALVRQLFEPFFTTEARGTGLGLHMAQELCGANGARLRYEPRDGERRSGFAIDPETTPAQETGVAERTAAASEIVQADGIVEEEGAVSAQGSAWQQKQTA
jgi:two-component system, NtrC family, sensor histidine kinase PilS